MGTLQKKHGYLQAQANKFDIALLKTNKNKQIRRHEE